MKKIILILFVFLLTLHARAELTPGTPAPEFPKGALWLGAGAQPPTMASLRGKVVLVDFWEYTCINCIRTFPHLKQLYARYHPAGLEIIGVHKGEFALASIPDNVKRAYERFKLPYPTVVDVQDQLWNAYDSHSWPNSFLIDGKGIIRLVHQGEGNYGELEREIQRLLKEQNPQADFSQFPIAPDKPLFGPGGGEQSPEIYVGFERGAQGGGQIANAEGFRPNQTVDYAATPRRVERGFFVQGPWKNRPDDFEAAAPSSPAKPVYLGITYRGRDVYAVFDHAGADPVTLVVTRDGQPVPAALRGQDLRVDPQGRTVLTIDEPRMYYVISKEDDQAHELRLEPQAAGTRICSFTFGNKNLENFERL